MEAIYIQIVKSMWHQGLEYGVMGMSSSNSVLLSKEPEAKYLIKLRIQCMLVPE